MSKDSKQLSNPFSTGSGGALFEAHVQASYLALMLTSGFAPSLPTWPICEIKPQAKHLGFNTDDLIVYVENPTDKSRRKMLGQVKHSLSITNSNATFADVIQAAWDDFNDTSKFTRNQDIVALITGPLSKTDTNDVRTLLEWARHEHDAAEFKKKVNLAKFSNKGKKQKLAVFEKQLAYANGGTALTDKQLLDFLKHFHLLIYDLDIRQGVILSLLHSMIGQYSQSEAQALWALIVEEVQSFNKNAGSITWETISEELIKRFKHPPKEEMPASLAANAEEMEPKPDKKPPPTNWNTHKCASRLVTASLVGTWNETNSSDQEIIERLAGEPYEDWITEIRELLQAADPPIRLKNGIWSVQDREQLWIQLGPRLFDDLLDNFKQSFLSVLSERDSKFDLPPGERFATQAHGKQLLHSANLREGLTIGLVLIGNRSEALINCKIGKPDTIVALSVRELLNSDDWVLWASLNTVLPYLAEAAPDDFLGSVERALQVTPCPFIEIFSQEGDGITGGNYITGLLWGLETLAWDPEYLVRSCLALGYLATRDPGGQWSNRPINSLSTILLPWLPQTLAPIEKRQAVLTTLFKETPPVAWNLIISLLPDQLRSSSGTRKPRWRKTIPKDWKKGVTHGEYWDQVKIYVDLAIAEANGNIGRLVQLVRVMYKLPIQFFNSILEQTTTNKILEQSEEAQLPLWNELTSLAAKHRKYSDAEWSLPEELLSKIDAAAEKLAPRNPLNLYRRLFGSREFDLYEENGNWQDQQRILNQRRQDAVREILSTTGIHTVVDFAKSVESPRLVGFSLGPIADESIDVTLLPQMLRTEDRSLTEFIGSYIWSRQQEIGWAWVDALDKHEWSTREKGIFFSRTSFCPEGWSRAMKELGEAESEYWTRTGANPYETDEDLHEAVAKLIKHGRPHAAVDLIHRMLLRKDEIDTKLTTHALLEAVKSKEPTHAMDSYQLEALIKALQSREDTDPEDLFKVEWAYLPLLDRHGETSPKHLESKLASDPDFFCEVIRLIYRSKKEKKKGKEPTEEEKAIATNAWRLLHEWKTPPGLLADGAFSKEEFAQWLQKTKETCSASGHLDVALNHIGQVLYHCPPDPNGLWINESAAEALNAQDAAKMRRGFNMEAYNSRGVHWVDPTGTPETELADSYRQKANDVENKGFARFATTLREMATSYEEDAKRIIDEHEAGDDE